jgi:hypothetical protein
MPLNQPEDEYFDASDEWVRVGKYTHHACCECGLVHRLRYRWGKDGPEERWTMSDKLTRRQRKKMKVKVARAPTKAE